jgi:hypothetical protein
MDRTNKMEYISTGSHGVFSGTRRIAKRIRNDTRRDCTAAIVTPHTTELNPPIQYVLPTSNSAGAV